jgi:hypothetical protein
MVAAFAASLTPLPALVWAAPAGALGSNPPQIFTPELSQAFVRNYRFLKGDTPNILKQG